MRLTNKFNLPQAFVAAAEAGIQPPSPPGRLRVTELIDAPQVLYLKRLHWDDIEEDVSDRVWAIFGTALHRVMQDHTHANTLTEEELSIEVGGITVTGHPDLYEPDETLDDWKVMPVWGIIMEDEGGKREHINQLNCYRVMFEAHNFPVKRLRIIPFLRDWSKREADKRPDYPQHNSQTVDITMWPLEQAKAYISERVRIHREAEGNHVSACTPEERWEKPAQWAVMKNDNKRASRVLDTEAEAQAWMKAQAADTKNTYRIEYRPGESTRCEFYCPFGRKGLGNCPQWKAIQAAQEQAHG